MKKTILLVDDDPGVRRMLSRLLTEEGYSVVCAAEGEAALRLSAGTPVNLALLDLSLPGQGGWEVFERLTAASPSLPVVIITAQPNQLFPTLAAGAGALMEKPLDLPKLLRTIHDLLEQPAEVHSARGAGRRTEFHYLPSPAGDAAGASRK